MSLNKSGKNRKYAQNINRVERSNVLKLQFTHTIGNRSFSTIMTQESDVMGIKDNNTKNPPIRLFTTTDNIIMSDQFSQPYQYFPSILRFHSEDDGNVGRYIVVKFDTLLRFLTNQL